MTELRGTRKLLVWTTLSVGVLTGFAHGAAAQPIGTFRWQLQPYCNVVTLAVTQTATLFTLDGADDQCGAGQAASALGTAFFNHDGSVGMGLHLVAAPGARPVHVTVTLNTATLSGTWADSAGHAGTFAFNPAAPAAGSPRPPGGGLNSVAVTTVVAGAGLTGGGATGPVNLAVAFGGPGAAATAARSDHTHAVAGEANTAVGSAAMAATSGPLNTAIGFDALRTNATGAYNTAVGALALRSNQTGPGNTALGAGALFSSTTASGNTAVGTAALDENLSGGENTAVGVASLGANVSGSRNVAVGHFSGNTLVNGTDNIYVGSDVGGAANENLTIRLGRTSGPSHVAAHVGGIYARTVDGATDLQVLIDNTGKLGTAVSSARAKQDVRDLGLGATGIERLRPVSFRYRPEQGRGDGLQYGLIAEEVADALPTLVVRDEDGVPVSVRYHQLPPLLVAEVQRLERERAAQESVMRALREEVAALRARDREVAAIEQRLAELERLLATLGKP